MQRLFTTFPGGSPGVGLGLLRLAVAIALVSHGAACAGDSGASLGIWAVGVLTALTGGLILLGLLTPLCSALAVITVAGLALSALPSPRNSVFDAWMPAVVVVLTAAALTFAGPGAFSVDAALFGRREITFPRPGRRGD